MKIRIYGDVAEIKQFLDRFIKICQNEYREQVKSNKILKITRATPIPVSLPKEFYMAHYYDDEGAVLGIPTDGLPRVFKWRIKKKMAKNLEGYFKANNIKVKVKVIEDGKKGNK